MKSKKVISAVFACAFIAMIASGCGSKEVFNMPEVDDTVSQLSGAVSTDTSEEHTSSVETDTDNADDTGPNFFSTDISKYEEESDTEQEAGLLESHEDEDGEILSSGNCGAEGGNVQYTLYENGNMYIYGRGDIKVFNNKPLFDDYRYDIKRVRIEDGVTSIGQKAFWGCGRMEEIIIPNGVTIIRKEAFYECTSLKSVSLPDSVTDIADFAFYSCSSLEMVTLSSNLKSISTECFSKCSALTGIEIPPSVKSIGMLAFSGCGKIKDVFFRGALPSFNGDQIFINYENEGNITSEDYDYMKVHYPKDNTTWESVTKNGQYGAFMGAQVEFVAD